jgi:hypothetical protein
VHVLREARAYIHACVCLWASMRKCACVRLTRAGMGGPANRLALGEQGGLDVLLQAIAVHTHGPTYRAHSYTVVHTHAHTNGIAQMHTSPHASLPGIGTRALPTPTGPYG